jgi:SSS family solute:Na+ symporter
MNLLMGWNIQLVIIFTSIAIIVYSMLGGIKAVIWTEAIQGFILIGGALICLVVLLFSMPEGPTQTFEMAISDHKFDLGSFSADLSTSTFWVCLIYGIFTNLQNYGIDQNYVQRYHTAKNEKEAKFSALFGGYLFIPVSAIFFLIGTALYTYYQVYPELLPAEGIKADYVFPLFIVNQLPTGLTGLLIASIFAAGMSTVATSVTSSSTIILTDYYQRIRKQTSDRERLWVLKVASLVIGILGILIALALVNVDSILDAWWKLSSIFSGGMLGLFLLGYLAKKAKNIDAAIGVICGAIVIAWISADQWLGLPESGIHEYLAIVLGTLIIFLVGFLSAHLFHHKK